MLKAGKELMVTDTEAVAVHVPSPAVTVMLYVPELLVVLQVGLPVLLVKLPPLLVAQL